MQELSNYQSLKVKALCAARFIFLQTGKNLNFDWQQIHLIFFIASILHLHKYGKPILKDFDFLGIEGPISKTLLAASFMGHPHSEDMFTQAEIDNYLSLEVCESLTQTVKRDLEPWLIDLYDKTISDSRSASIDGEYKEDRFALLSVLGRIDVEAAKAINKKMEEASKPRNWKIVGLLE